MSNTTRWILAALLAVGLFLCSGVVGITVFAPIAFGTTCLVAWLLVPPLLMIAGGVTGAVWFGMNKPRSRWLGAILLGGILGLVAYGAWFTVAPRVCQ